MVCERDVWKHTDGESGPAAVVETSIYTFGSDARFGEQVDDFACYLGITSVWILGLVILSWKAVEARRIISCKLTQPACKYRWGSRIKSEHTRI